MIKVLQMSGLDPARARRSFRGLREHRRNRRTFLGQAGVSGREFRIGDSIPCLADRYEEGGVARGHYFHIDLHVAQQIFEAAPERHIDVGSRVDGFVAHVASFRTVEVLDVRPIRSEAENIAFFERDIMKTEPEWDSVTDSLSCLHALEHMGLGRYGDTVDYYGYLKAWDNLIRMVRPGGRFYFAVPIGEDQRVEFDAHRVFNPQFVRDIMVGNRLDIEAFAYVDDSGSLHRDLDPALADDGWTAGLRYGCGIFTLRRR